MATARLELRAAEAVGSVSPDRSLATATQQPRYRSLDLWRGLACLLVIVHHSVLVHKDQREGPYDFGSYLIDLASQGNIGVPIFFVISGYCIAASADSARRKGSSVRSFFVRRFRRIFPPYLILVMFLVGIHVFLDYILFPGILSAEPWAQMRPWHYSGWSWLGNLTLTETWREHLIGGPRGHYPGQNWTLCYEEQFYAVMGLSLLLFRRNLFLNQALTSFSVLVIAIVGSRLGLKTSGFFFDGRWLTFAAGIAVYYWVQYADRRQRWGIVLSMILFALWSLLFPQYIPGGRPAFCFALMLLMLHRWDTSISSARLLQPVAWCGTMCYSLYLVHQIPVKAVSQGLYWAGVTGTWSTLMIVVPACMAVSVALGYTFYLGVERHFLNAPTPR